MLGTIHRKVIKIYFLWNFNWFYKSLRRHILQIFKIDCMKNVLSSPTKHYFNESSQNENNILKHLYKISTTGDLWQTEILNIIYNLSQIRRRQIEYLVNRFLLKKKCRTEGGFSFYLFILSLLYGKIYQQRHTSGQYFCSKSKQPRKLIYVDIFCLPFSEYVFICNKRTFKKK